MTTTTRSAAYISIGGTPAWELRERHGDEEIRTRVRHDFNAVAWVRGEIRVTPKDTFQEDE